eukprot:CAMPEP_0197038836 /NCGR_PEP_ID=MMETSP1384-20130603/15721_1 /TAXON_ID=29189 /ORGANISM="Ammonia sp." /LENGTH=571 /DNA_ID=CAMNT_0042469331 /DNA_START=26 /DNA_END=1738 /DNA_ORIENTATION=-
MSTSDGDTQASARRIANLLQWFIPIKAVDEEKEDELVDVAYLETLFHSLDTDGDKQLTKEELFAGFIQHGAGDRFTESEILTVLHFLDRDGDGVVDFDEFYHLFHRLNVHSMHDLMEKAYLYVLFAQIDDDASGKIDARELKQFFIANDIELADDDIHRLMHQVDTDGDGLMDFYEFYEIFNAVHSFGELVTQSRLRVIFNSIDEDMSGELELHEIEQLFKKEKVDISQTQLRQMIAQIDENGDGVIDFDEFQHAFEKITSVSDLVYTWQNLNSIDVGSDLSVGSGLSNFSWLPIFAGGCGGITSRTVTAPLERAKILAQTGKNDGASMMQTFMKIVERQGFWGGLWKGNLWGCLRTFPFAGCVTFTYTMFLQHVVPKSYRNRIDNPTDPVTHVWRFSAGLTAGCVATTITYPLDLLKANEAVDMTDTKRQRLQNRQLTLVHRIRHSLRIETIKANFWHEMKENRISSFKDAFRGLVPTIFAVPFFIGIQNATYDFLRIYCTSPDHLNMTPSIQLFATCGIAAGVTAQSITYPIDLIRRRMQTGTMWIDPTVTKQFETLHKVDRRARRKMW